MTSHEFFVYIPAHTVLDEDPSMPMMHPTDAVPLKNIPQQRVAVTAEDEAHAAAKALQLAVDGGHMDEGTAKLLRYSPDFKVQRRFPDDEE